MSGAAFIVTTSIWHDKYGGKGSPAVTMLSNSKYPRQPNEPLRSHLVAALNDVVMTRKRPTLGITSLFRPPPPVARRSSDVSTSSMSRSQSRSTSPTSSFLIDDDPFAKIDSPVSYDFNGPDSLSPTSWVADASPRVPLAPRQPDLQRHSHDHDRPPVSSRAKPHKSLRNTPSLPSLSDLARATGSSYASTIARTKASKRFPLEPWDLPHVKSFKPDENSRIQPPHSHSPDATTNTPLLPQLPTNQPSPVPGTVSLSLKAPCPLRSISLVEDNASRQCTEAALQHLEPSWWDIVHDCKDARESEEDSDSGDEPVDTPGPLISQVVWQSGQGHRTDALRGNGDHCGDDTPNDHRSKEYPSPRNGGGLGGGNGSGRGQGRDDDDDKRIRSAFSDDPETETDTEEASSSEEDSEDNIPLAQRIPNALQAQRSIRIKDRAERERRRRERQAKKHALMKPAGSVHKQSPLADDLTKRLLQVQTSESVAAPGSSTSQQQVHRSRGVVAQAVQQQPPTTSRTTYSLRRPAAPGQPQLRHVSLEEVRPHHNQNGESGMPHTQELGSAPLSRHATTASRSREPSLSRSTTQSAQAQQQPHSRPSISARLPPRVPLQEEVRHKSQDIQDESRTHGTRARTLSSAAAAVSPPPTTHTHRVLQRTRSSAPMAPMPVVEVKRSQQGQPEVTRHRVFIGDMQRFNSVEIGPQTSARDVLDLVEARGELRGTSDESGGWMLWEIAQDFGMERPLRDYELPAEVYSSWNSNTRANAFMIKKTPLAFLLAREAIPPSSPRFKGYVQWESKRGKWNKRWMELREHGIWLSKRDNLRDETFLCSLSSFDCYYVSRSHKAPKPFVFAVKSTDNLTLFENPADYLHVFSCDMREGQQWMERVLLARSYVLHKERTVLFSNSVNPSSSTSPSSNVGSQKVLPRSRPAAPLVNVNTQDPFQSGSLLAKQ